VHSLVQENNEAEREKKQLHIGAEIPAISETLPKHIDQSQYRSPLKLKKQTNQERQ